MAMEKPSPARRPSISSGSSRSTPTLTGGPGSPRINGFSEVMLDEDRFIHDAGQQWITAFRAASHLAAEDFIVFPWGMGAFLRNLRKNDQVYGDGAKMRHLRSRLAANLFKAAVEILPTT